MIKEKNQHKLLLSKKVVLLSGDRVHAEPSVAAQTGRRPGELWRSGSGPQCQLELGTADKFFTGES